MDVAVYFGIYLLHSYLSSLSLSSAPLVTVSAYYAGALGLLKSITSWADGGVLEVLKATKIYVDLHCVCMV